MYRIVSNGIRRITYSDNFGGILLFLSGLSAIVLSNSTHAWLYDKLIEYPIGLSLPLYTLSKPAIFWINDGLMAVFFLLVGLEIKREIRGGMLSERSRLALPFAGALGGMLLPSCLYILCNYGQPASLNGWAIPAATDIAFSLGILSLLGKAVPVNLKLFLTALAVLDDIGAILIIAVFYTPTLSWMALCAAIICTGSLFLLNRLHVTRLTPYLVIGALLWFSVLQSGVHATLAGVVLAFMIPHDENPLTDSPLERLEKTLFSSVTFWILPLFAFCNSGFSLHGMHLNQLLDPITLGIVLGLVVGKQLGVFSACWLAVKMGVAQLPESITWSRLYAVAVVCGVGFTMSLFIGGLAFAPDALNAARSVRLGICLGSTIAGVMGYWLVKRACR